MSIPRPADTEKCNGCHHVFAEHYTTYDNAKAGCSHYDNFQRDGGPCSCKGYALIWIQ